MTQLVIAKVSTLKGKISNVNYNDNDNNDLEKLHTNFRKISKHTKMRSYSKIFEKKEKYEYHFRMSYGLHR